MITPTKKATSSNIAGLLEGDRVHLSLPSTPADLSPNTVVVLSPQIFGYQSTSADMKKVSSRNPRTLGGILGTQQRTTAGGKRQKINKQNEIHQFLIIIVLLDSILFMFDFHIDT